MANRRTRKARKRSIETRREETFNYRGRELEELQELSMEELLPLLPARARRKLSRGLREEERTFLEKIEGADEDEVVRTHLRGFVILPSMVEKTVAVHTGSEFQRVTIQPEMIGHYLGEFAMTRKQVEHTGPGVGATRSSKYMPLK